MQQMAALHSYAMCHRNPHLKHVPLLCLKDVQSLCVCPGSRHLKHFISLEACCSTIVCAQPIVSTPFSISFFTTFSGHLIQMACRPPQNDRGHPTMTLSAKYLLNGRSHFASIAAIISSLVTVFSTPLILVSDTLQGLLIFTSSCSLPIFSTF